MLKDIKDISPIFITIFTFISEILRHAGLWDIRVFSLLLIFSLFFWLDFQSKKLQYERAFYNIDVAVKVGAWKTNVKRTQIKHKLKEYLIMLLAGIGFIHVGDTIQPINIAFNIGEFNLVIDKTFLYILLFALMCNIEFKSIYENFVKDFSPEEKKKWDRPNIYYENPSQEVSKWSAFMTVASTGFGLVDMIVNFLSKRKGDDK